MAGIGDDIKEVLNELGTSAIISRIGGSTFQEKVDYTAFPEHSSEFIREFFYTMTVAWDSAVRTGDMVSFSGMNFLVTNIDQSSFEDSPVDNIAALYRCNVRGALKRFSEGVPDSNYIKQHTWENVATNPSAIYALQYENKFGFEQTFQEGLQALFKEKHLLFLPGALDVAIDDRWYPDYADVTSYYRISVIERRRLDNCLICTLEEDNRG